MVKTVSPAAVPPRSLLKKLAGKTYFERGEGYYDRGFVLDAVSSQGRLVAKVQGTYRSTYQVRLTWDGKALDWECSCPLGEEGEFCKHCVASALAWLEGDSQSADPEGVVSLTDVKHYLSQQKKALLVDLVIEQAMSNPRLRDRLLIQAAQGLQGKGVNLQALQTSLKKAIQVRDFLDYHDIPAYAEGVAAMIESLKDLLEAGFAAETVTLTEDALHLLEEARNEMDDPEDLVSDLLEALQELHHAACLQAKPPLEPLVERLFTWQIETEWDLFLNLPVDYADVFGEEGLAIYRRLAEAAWAKVPALKPGDQPPSGFGRRYALTHIMIWLARQAEDLEALAAVLARDLSTPYPFLALAELYQKAGFLKQSITWAEQGLAAFPNWKGQQLQSFLINLYHQSGQSQKSVELAWQAFTEVPELRTYQVLKAYTVQPDAWEDPWPPMRVKALAFLREEVQRRYQAHRKSRDTLLESQRQPNQTELVKILLWEGQGQAAWEEAQQGWCPLDLWLELAQSRKKTHPEDALKIYKAQVEPAIALKNKTGYKQAADYLVKIQRLMTQMNQQAAFKQYLHEIRVTHKAKRNFIKRLDTTQGLR